MPLINQGIFYLQSEVDQAASLGAAQEAIHLLIPFCHIGYIQNYLAMALQILTHWGIDVEAYLQAGRDAYKNDSSNAL